MDHTPLHQCALLGDDEGVRRALLQGADVNALDASGRTAIMCAVAGENWQNLDASDASFMTPARVNTLKTLLNRPEISLLTLNSPQSSMNGVIPLGMAAWLNQPLAVRTLLEDSAEAVSVDGMDSHGATALMYAARDGSLEVVQLLLSHGARPDFRDRNHRTSIQFALAHPQILWLCESVLRRHRWRESKSAERTRLASSTEYLVQLSFASLPFSEDLQPPPMTIFTKDSTSRLTAALISSIRSSDVAFLNSLLFSPALPASSPSRLYPMSVPALVNIPDSDGWSPVHHCVAAAQPSVDILDALYCAGADVSLFTTHEQQTPLHIIARYAQPDNSSSACSLHDFVLHLVHDLRAPLSARDKDDETCLHIAAEHGLSLDLLILLVDCDANGTVREMKNSRGLTPLEVCQRDFLTAFRKDEGRSPSALSNYTIRATDSFASLASISELHTMSFTSSSDSSSIMPTPQIDVDGTIQALLFDLRASSPGGNHFCTPAHIAQLEACVDEANEHSQAIALHFRSRIEEASRMVRELQENAEKVNSVRNLVKIASKTRLVSRGITPLLCRKRLRESEDSQTTICSMDSASMSNPSTLALSTNEPQSPTDQYVSKGTQTAVLDLFAAPPAWAERLFTQPQSQLSDSTILRAYLEGLLEADRELQELQELASAPGAGSNGSPTKLALKLKTVLKKKRKFEDKIREFEASEMAKLASFNGGSVSEKQGSWNGSISGMKAWLKKIVVPSPIVSVEKRQHQQAQAPTTKYPRKLQIVYELDEQSSPIGREVKQIKASSISSSCGDAIDASIDTALRTSQVVLESAYHDLRSVQECLAAAEQFIELANHSISRAQRVVKRAVKKREALIADLQAQADKESRLAADGQSSPGMLGYVGTLSCRSSLASISTIYSTCSSVLSVAATLTEHDDEDTKVIRRLLLRKIEAQTSGAWDEVDKVMGWLQIVKEAVRGVKRRAYL